jgi:molybdopterin synthase catalytic subunit
MRVKVRLFGGPRELLGWRELEQEIVAGSTAKQLIEGLVREFPVLNGCAPAIKIAVNRRYADEDTELHEGDEVACIPPVAGG